VAGRSARAEYDRRVAKREAAITERWGTGFAAGVVRAITTEPQSTRAWAIGAAGEATMAAELATVPGLRVLNDRRVSGTNGNIDHIVIAPAGVFVVDAKNHKGKVEIKNRGWFLKPDYRLTIGGRVRSSMVDGLDWQVGAVTATLQAGHLMPPVVPVLCFLEAEWPLAGAPEEFRGVRLESPGSIKRLVTNRPILDGDQIAKITAVLTARLPPR
jgi:hypothetical protein